MRERMFFVFSVIMFSSLFSVHIYSQFTGNIPLKKDIAVAKIGKEEVKMSEIMPLANQLNKFLKENFVTSPDWRFDFVRDFITMKALEKYAVKNGIDKKDEVKQKLKDTRTQILASYLVNMELAAKYRVTEEDKKKFYEDNKKQYTEPEKARLRHIEISDEKTGEIILERLKKGEDFNALAKEFSEDENTKNNGGLIEDYASPDLPFTPFPEMQQETIQELIKLQKGVLMQLIKIDNKYHIFKSEEFIPQRLKPYQEVKRQIDAEIERSTKEKIVSEFIKQVFQKEAVVIYEEEIKKDIFSDKDNKDQ